MRLGLKGLLLANALALSGCYSSYLDAAGKFATATSDSTATLQGAVDLHHRLCERRARLDYLQHRLEGTNTVDGHPDGAVVYWDRWPSTFKPSGGGQTWDATCAASKDADEVLRKLLAILSAYADAMATVSGEDYAGADVGGLVNSAEATIAKLPGDAKSAAAVLKALGKTADGQPGPIGSLAGALKKSYAAKHVAELVAATDPAVTVLLSGIDRYLTAVALEEGQWEHDTRKLLDSLDRSLPAPGEMRSAARIANGRAEEPPTKAALSEATAPAKGRLVRPDPVDVIEFMHSADRALASAENTRALQQSLQDAVSALQQAEAALVRANGNSRSPSVGTVLGLITEVLGDIAAAKAAINQGATQ
jgi:hypothetical protein